MEINITLNTDDHSKEDLSKLSDLLNDMGLYADSQDIENHLLNEKFNDIDDYVFDE